MIRPGVLLLSPDGREALSVREVRDGLYGLEFALTTLAYRENRRASWRRSNDPDAVFVHATSARVEEWPPFALSGRARDFLVALVEIDSDSRGDVYRQRGVNSGRVARVAYPDAPYSGRIDAGATRTLDALATLNLVRFEYTLGRPSSRVWSASIYGRAYVEALTA
jgi:hypothetical protein